MQQKQVIRSLSPLLFPTAAGKLLPGLLSFRRQIAALFLLGMLFLPFSGHAYDSAIRTVSPVKDAVLKFRNFSVAQGLPSSETYFVHEDRQGYVWICSDRGVVRFDGYRFRIFTKKDGLMDNVVFSIYEDYKGRLWFVGNNSELCYYENGKIVPYAYNHIILKKMRGYSRSLKDLCIDREKGVILSFYTYLSFSISWDGAYTELSPFNRNRFEIWEHGEEVHFIATAGMANIVRGKENVLPLRYRNTIVGRILVVNDIRCVKYKGILFFGTNHELYMVKNGKAKLLSAGGHVISLNSCNGYLWVGIHSGGVKKYVLDQRDGIREVDHLWKSFSITHVMSDTEGGYWFTTLEDGVKYVPDMFARVLGAGEGLLHENVSAVCGIGTHIFIVCNHRVLQQLNSPFFSYSCENNITLGKLNGQVLVSCYSAMPLQGTELRRVGKSGQRDGVFANKDSYLLKSNVIESVDKKGRSQVLCAEDNIAHAQIASMMLDAQGELYYADNASLFRVVNGKSKRISLGGELKATTGKTIALVSDPAFGSMAFTREKGLLFFEGGQLTGKLTLKDGLLSNQLNAGYVDSYHRLWIGSNRGLNCVRKTNGRYSIAQFTTANGLLSNEVNSIYEYGNKIWVATKKGVSILDLNNRPAGTQDRDIFLEEIVGASGRRIPERHPVFKSGTTYVKIVLRTSNFRGAPYHQFRYSVNRESGWVTTFEREIVLNNPKYGAYNIRVAYRNENGEWSKPKLISSFTIDPPYYATWYFIALMVIAGFSGIYLLFRLRLRQLNQKYQLQRTINKLEQKALSAQMNPHFIFNSLNSIQSFLIYEENEKAEKYLLKFSSLIRQTLANSRDRYIRIEQEIAILKDYLELEQMRFRGKFSWNLQSSLTVQELQYFLPPMLIQPYVENAIIHGVSGLKEGGMILITLEMASENELKIVIDDNGVGRKKRPSAKNSSHRSFGTTITSERLRFFNVTSGDNFRIDIHDKKANGESSGTTIRLTLPILKYYDAENSSNH